MVTDFATYFLYYLLMIEITILLLDGLSLKIVSLLCCLNTNKMHSCNTQKQFTLNYDGNNKDNYRKLLNRF